MSRLHKSVDLQLRGPANERRWDIQMSRVIHVAKGSGVMSFPNTGERIQFRSGDILLVNPGVRELYFNSKVIHYRHRSIAGLPHAPQMGTKLHLSATHRELLLQAITEIRHCPEKRQDLLIDLIQDLLEAFLQQANHPVDELDELVSMIHENPLRFSTTSALAEQLNVSPERLRRLFQQRFQTTPKRFLLTQRFQFARNLLSETGFSVQDVAAQLGYQDAFIFSKQYRKEFGRPPSEDRSSRGVR